MNRREQMRRRARLQRRRRLLEKRLAREHAHEPMPAIKLRDVAGSIGLDSPTWLETELGTPIYQPPTNRGWTEPVASAKRDILVRAAKGYTANIVEVRPGLYVVATVPDHVATHAQTAGEPNVGFWPLLVPALASVVKSVAEPISDAVERARAQREQRRQQARVQASQPPAPYLYPAPAPASVQQTFPTTTTRGW